VKVLFEILKDRNYIGYSMSDEFRKRVENNDKQDKERLLDMFKQAINYEEV